MFQSWGEGWEGPCLFERDNWASDYNVPLSIELCLSTFQPFHLRINTNQISKTFYSVLNFGGWAMPRNQVILRVNYFYMSICKPTGLWNCNYLYLLIGYKSVTHIVHVRFVFVDWPCIKYIFCRVVYVIYFKVLSVIKYCYRSTNDHKRLAQRDQILWRSQEIIQRYSRINKLYLSGVL